MPQPSREQLLQWDKHHYWHAFTQMAEYEPFVVESGRGCTLIDIDGREYLDGVSSLWCNVHGHRHPRIDAAIRDQLDKIAHCTSLGASNSTSIQLARKLAEITPGNLDHVFFSSDGACAIEVALKIAFQYWQQRDEPRPDKTEFIAFTEAYHGDTLGSVSVGGVARFHDLFRPLLFDTIRAPIADPRMVPADVGNDDVAQHYLDKLEILLQEHHAHTTAIVIEPLVQCACGMIMHPKGFLRGVRDLATEYNVLLIADEIATGFGRTGTMFACQQEEVVPDILCLGKGITGGYLPMAATITTDEIYRTFLGDFSANKTLYHGHTYSGNPLAAAAALANLDIFEQETTLDELTEKIARLGVHLSRLTTHAHVVDARQTGFMAAIELAKEKDPIVPFEPASRVGYNVCRDAIDRGVWLRPLGDVIVIMPPLSITLDQLDRMTEAVAKSIDAVTN